MTLLALVMSIDVVAQTTSGETQTYTDNQGVVYELTLRSRTEIVATVVGLTTPTSTIGKPSLIRKTSITIPNILQSTHTGQTTIRVHVVGIKSGAFSSVSYLKSVTIASKGEFTIASNAFSKCSNLESVTLPASTIIEEGAFDHNSARNAELKIVPTGNYTSVESTLGKGATGFKKIVFDEGISSIGPNAFEIEASPVIVSPRPSLLPNGPTSIVLPSTLGFIDAYAFRGCTAIQDITVNNETPPAVDENAYPFTGFTATLNVPTGSKQNYLYHTYWGQFGDNIHDEYYVDKTTGLRYEITFESDPTGAPSGNSVAKCLGMAEGYTVPKIIRFPSTISLSNGLVCAVTSIADEAFMNCTNIQEVHLPSYMTTIGERAFYGCGNLKTVSITTTTTNIDVSAFANCGLFTLWVYYGENSYIPYGFFAECSSVKDVIIKDGITMVNYHAFENCSNLKSVDFPTTLSSICGYAFQNSPIERVNIPSSVNTILGGAFSNAQLKKVVLNSSILLQMNKPNEYFRPFANSAMEAAAAQDPSGQGEKVKLLVPYLYFDRYKEHDFWGKYFTVEANLVTNGDLEGDDVSCFWTTEEPTAPSPSAIVPATTCYQEGINYSDGIKVTSVDTPTNEWDTQFFIRLCKPLPADTKFRVSFDCKAKRETTVRTSLNRVDDASPTMQFPYLSYNALGLVNFTTEWKHYESEIITSPDDQMQVITFMLSPLGQESNDFYFDNIEVEEIVEEEVELANVIKNSNLEGTDVSCFFTRGEDGNDQYGIVPATIVEGKGKDYSRAIEVTTVNNPGNRWDTQFFIRLPQTLPAGTKFHVSFDYKADIDTGTDNYGVDTQSHNEPSEYIHYQCIGNIFPRTYWQRFSEDVVVPAACDGSNYGSYNRDFRTIAFNLSLQPNSTHFYFDNIEVACPTDGENTEPEVEMIDIVKNGSLEGNDKSCFYAVEQFVDEDGWTILSAIGPATIVDGEGVNGSRCIKVQSHHDPSHNWNSMFFLRLPQTLPEGTKYRFSFDYRASELVPYVGTQTQQEPGQYLYWDAFNDTNPQFTTQWQHFEKEGTITADQSPDGTPMQTIAFLLAQTDADPVYYFDNIVYEIDIDHKQWDMNNLVKNGDLQGCYMYNFRSAGDQGKDRMTVESTRVVTDAAGMRSLEITTGTTHENEWDTQFFIRLPQALHAGTKFHIAFDYMADDDVQGVTTQTHAEPTYYIDWRGIGTLDFTTQWKHFDLTSTVTSTMSPNNDMKSIAFLLAKNMKQVTYHFRNIVFEVDDQRYITPEAEEGDANGDGTVSVTDIALIVNRILSLPQGTFYEIGGDANGDGEVTVTDIGVIVDMILGNDANGGNYGNARRMTDDTVEPQ